MGFDITAAIAGKTVSKLDTAETKQIAVSLLDPNPNNFFPVEDDITDLCESIKLNGLLQPPVVTPAVGGRYRIIAGHRRHKALQALAEELPNKFGTVLCRVVRPSSPELEELMLIQTNTEARELGWCEKNESATRVEKILVALQKQGLELPGKMRSHVAKIIKTSESQIARAKYIAEHLIESLQNRSGITDSAAYKLAHLPEEQQQELYEHYKTNLYCLSNGSIQQYLDNIAAGRAPFYTPPPAPRDCYKQRSKGGAFKKCTHAEIIKRRSKKKLPEYQKCGWRDCCANCGYQYDCEDVCPIVEKEVVKHQKTENYRVCHALRVAREQKGMSFEDACKALNLSDSQLLQYETANCHTVGSLSKLCKLYGVTPNQILGFGETTSVPAPHEWIPAGQIGDLPDGLYFMLYEYKKPYVREDGRPLAQNRAVLRRDGRWHLTPSGKPLAGLSGDEKLVAVLPSPPIPDAWSLMLEPFDTATNDGGNDDA